MLVVTEEAHAAVLIGGRGTDKNSPAATAAAKARMGRTQGGGDAGSKARPYFGSGLGVKARMKPGLMSASWGMMGTLMIRPVGVANHQGWLYLIWRYCQLSLCRLILWLCAGNRCSH